MRILIIGSGAREHALAWKVRQSPLCTALFCAPGNAGIAALAECTAIGVMDFEGLIAFARAKAIDLTIVGPDDPLAGGIVDAFEAAGLKIFGPTRAAARLESSKAFVKALAHDQGIPCARSATFADEAAAHAYLASLAPPYVIKADGLAQGKGVVIAPTLGEAREAVSAMLSGAFGEAGRTLVIEEFLTGEEASFFVLCDGTTAVPLDAAQDHKRAFDGDQGPNTGGMGTYSPAPVFTPAHEAFTMARIVRPTLSAMAAMGAPFRGILFVGLMIGTEGPKLIEFNARFGDPECQSLMVRLESDLLEGMLAALDGRLGTWAPVWSPDTAVTVVMAAKGYPGTYPKGTVIEGTERATALPGVQVFHATTARDAAGRLTAQGGRTLSLTALAPTLSAARAQAYAAARLITWPEGYFRTDIAAKMVGK